MYTSFKTVMEKYTDDDFELALYDFYYSHEIYNSIDYDGWEPTEWQMIKAIKEYFSDDSIILED